MERRSFIKNSTLATGALITHPSCASEMFNISRKRLLPLNQLKKPLAIAMWDFSWILRHHQYGEFENWDNVLNDLAERGYNAIRIDVMPQYIAADSDGIITEEFRSVKNSWQPVRWGNYYTMSFRPREALLEFLPKCTKYGIRVGLASWFVNHDTGPRGIFLEEQGLIRAWIETLNFLKKHELLDDNIIYVDLLNEYPVYHGYDWFKKQLNSRGDVKQFKLDNPNAFMPDEDETPKDWKFNSLQLKFQHEYGNNLIKTLKDIFPEQIFHMSLTCTTPLESVDFSQFGTLDYHLWLSIIGDIPHWRSILANIDQCKDNRTLCQNLMKAWIEKKPQIIRLADQAISAVSNTAKKYNIPCGNTEGWGPVGWSDHPELNWIWVREAAEIAVELTRKYDNYKYICTSNFTHPQFKGMWEDIKWHRKITEKIKT